VFCCLLRGEDQAENVEIELLVEVFFCNGFEGDLPSDSDPADLARFLATVIHGMSVQAASGASRNELLGIIQTALRAWPE